jgi:hypothetical protein
MWGLGESERFAKSPLIPNPKFGNTLGVVNKALENLALEKVEIG